jgi:hypothetical protein
MDDGIPMLDLNDFFFASLEKGVGGCKLNVTDMQSSPDRAVCVAGSNWHSTTAVRT